MPESVQLAILCDYLEERWPSMDLAGDMLAAELQSLDGICVQKIRPRFHRRLANVPGLADSAMAKNADRLINRMWDYPRVVRGLNKDNSAQFFHIVDHSYSQLAHDLPRHRSGVFCHDLDTFRCILDPASDPRPRWFQAMARRILAGMQSAAVVFHATQHVREQIERFKLIAPSKLVHAPLGVSQEFSPVAADPEPADALLSRWPADAVYLLHVGSCIARKRIDVLLEIFAAARRQVPGLKLVQAGGTWTPAQQRQIATAGIDADILQLRQLERAQLSSLYRRSAAVLLTSDAEGFGLPLIEALSCGRPVIASDIPVFREVAGPAATYCEVGAIRQWVASIEEQLKGSAGITTEQRLAQASQYSWARHAQIIRDAYLNLEAR
jgi:glycosyltransferase involved in cell wall biosynthesis